jgi:hypothetical protein
MAAESFSFRDTSSPFLGSFHGSKSAESLMAA